MAENTGSATELCHDQGGVDFWCELPARHAGDHQCIGGPSWSHLDVAEVADIVTLALPQLEGEDLDDALEWLLEEDA